jgi:hypothetical protein
MKTLSFRGFLLLLLTASIFQLQAQTPFSLRLSEAAISLTKQQVTYDPSYFVIHYPNGDMPPNKGVCTDVVIRAYRLLKIDLQQLVHKDMKANFKLYPKKWGLVQPDKNIDHSRILPYNDYWL